MTTGLSRSGAADSARGGTDDLFWTGRRPVAEDAAVDLSRVERLAVRTVFALYLAGVLVWLSLGLVPTASRSPGRVARGARCHDGARDCRRVRVQRRQPWSWDHVAPASAGRARASARWRSRCSARPPRSTCRATRRSTSRGRPGRSRSCTSRSMSSRAWPTSGPSCSSPTASSLTESACPPMGYASSPSSAPVRWRWSAGAAASSTTRSSSSSSSASRSP